MPQKKDQKRVAFFVIADLLALNGRVVEIADGGSPDRFGIEFVVSSVKSFDPCLTEFFIGFEILVSLGS